MKLQQIIQTIAPPFLYDIMHRCAIYLNKDNYLYWQKTNDDWKTAQLKCIGYNESSILEKVKNATNEVLSGKASYERDAVLFYEADYNLNVLASLQYVFQQQKKLQVIDFGGALGSTYHQHKKFLDEMPNMHWHIVEQENYIACGKANFTTEKLSFHNSIQELQTKQIDVVLFSCVLHYLEHPFQFIETAVAANIPYLIIDRTPFIQADKDLITIQHVPEKIYKASYVCKLFSEDVFMSKLLNYYDLIWEFDNQIHINIPCTYKGLFLKLKTTIK